MSLTGQPLANTEKGITFVLGNSLGKAIMCALCAKRRHFEEKMIDSPNDMWQQVSGQPLQHTFLPLFSFPFGFHWPRTISDMSLPETRLTTRLITRTAIQRTFFCFLLWSWSNHCWNSYPRIENTIHELERSHTERGEWKKRTEEEI